VRKVRKYFALGCALAFGLAFLYAGASRAQSVCAIVKLQISQKATLEREAFNADLNISNNVPNQPLTNLKVQVFIKDANGNPADQFFFVAVSSLSGVNAIDGTGVIQSSSSADINWIIIPSTGAGGTLPQGLNYSVSALISSTQNGTPQTLNTFPATITVMPQPALSLEYAIPFEVFGEEPLLLPNTVTPIIPFPLAVRVLNVGYGPADNFQIQSAQPKIVDNKQGLDVSFTLLGTNVEGITAPNSLLVNFGNIPPGGAAQASWIMSASLSGQFISFTSTFTHAAALGGQLTSLIQNISDYTLLSQVQVDVPVPDTSPDFLVNTNSDRLSMEGLLDSGVQPPAQLILESDYQTPIQVTEVPAALSGTLGAGSGSLTISFSQPVSSGVWAHSYVPFPYGNTQDGISPAVASAVRADGKKINPQNVWISKHFVKSSLKYIFWLNILDFTSGAASYAVNFSSAGLDLPPGAVPNLAATTALTGGTLNLNWTAPGDDGFIGNMLGGSYFIESSLSSTTAFAPGSAQTHFATNTVANAPQSYSVSGLVGNATNYLVLWTQDPGGNMSPLSNTATAYTLPDPPTGFALIGVSSRSLTAAWQIGDNSLPIAYEIFLATSAAGIEVSSSPLFDSFTTSFTFTNLTPNTPYFVFGKALNPITLVSSPLNFIPSAFTLAAPPIPEPYADTNSSGTTAVWSPGLDPPGTQFLAELSTSPAGAPVLSSSGWITTSSFTFTNLTTNATYYGFVKARNFNLVETGLADLGPVLIRPPDIQPPRTSLIISSPSFAGAGTIPSSTTFATGHTTMTLSSIDDLISTGDALGLGVAFQSLSIDGSTPTIFTDTSPGVGQIFNSSFTLAHSSDGLHFLDYFAQDITGNREMVHIATVAVDNTPPISSLAISSPLYNDFVSSASVFALSAIDPTLPASSGVASGVKETFIAVDTTNFSVYSASFTLPGPDGTKTLSFYSEDNVLNLETVKSATVLLDMTPPETQLAFTGGTQFSTPSIAGIYASSLTFISFISTDPIVNGVASGVAFTEFNDDGGSFQNYSSSFTLAEGVHFLDYQSEDHVQNLEILRSTTVLIDATPPVTTISIGSPTYTSPSGTIYVSTYAPISLGALDPPLPQISTAIPAFPGSGVASTQIAIDTTVFSVYAGSFSLAEGIHVILYRSIDHVGNIEATRQIQIESDGTPPVSSISIGQPQFALSTSTVLVSSITPFVIVSTDPLSNNVASGVKNSFFSVNGSSFAVYAGSFTLIPPDGPQTVSFYSVDNVLNAEIAKSSSVILDSTPPTLALLSPASCDLGICRVVKGKFPVLGSVYDLYFASYTLSYAPGQNASSGFTQISSGSVAISSGVLGFLDASNLSGWQTLKLSASDLVQNASSVQINVFVGDPGELMILGNDDVFNLPEGVAVSSSGDIFIADTNADRIEVYSTTGAFQTSFGTHPGNNADDQTVSTTTLILNKPSGVSLDGAGNIYVADANDDRVLKLSAAGQTLLTLGRKKTHKDGRTEFQPGNGPGEFNKPSGIAVDLSGNIYVSDTENNRVQIFNSSGAFISSFLLPPVSVIPAKAGIQPSIGEGAPRPNSLKSGQRDEKSRDLGKPFGIAVDASGRIYVADPKAGRALVFGTTGQLLLTIPITESNGEQRKETESGGKKPSPLSAPSVASRPAVRGEPFGIAVSTDGECLLVSDRKFDRVLKFDNLGDPTLGFGKFGQISDEKSPPAKIVFHKPVGLALDASGSLFVADRDNDRIEKFSLPESTQTLIVPPPGPEDDEIARGVVDKDLGGKINRPDNAAANIPPGALAHDLKVSVSSVTAQNISQLDVMAETAQKNGLTPAYAPVDFGPEGTVFQTSATLTLPYDPVMLKNAGLADDDLKIRWWNPSEGVWQDLDSTVDKVNHLVTAKTGHFSLYQVLAGTSSTRNLSPLSAPTAFQFVDLYAFPNPAKGAQYPDIRVQVGLADSVDIHIYDISGRLIKTTTVYNPQILDDGNGKGLQYTFDYLWNTGNVGSGVYIYAITAHKSGASNISRVKKLAVIR
jgi:hypothetical protein